MDPAKDDFLKRTVNLPRTSFPQKANLTQNEPKTLARWEQQDLYGNIRAARAGRPMFVLHDGPPYANGNIHLGHAFNKLLKDFIVKSKTMSGFDSPYIPGWDCHGLPIEIKVDNELGSKKASMTVAEIRGECRKYAQKYVDLQREDFKRLGVLGRWSDPYLTMSAEFESVIAGAFVDFLEKGHVYKGLKPVNWCINDRTALAEAEVEYENHTSPSIWVRFALLSDPAAIAPELAGKRVYGLIWTTTPWTMPANMAIAYHPNFDYVAAEVDSGVYLVAEALLAQTAEAAGWSAPRIVARFKGVVLENSLFAHPFLERTSRGILGEHVTLEQGTGAVHTAPGHGQEDFVAGRQYGIATYCPVDAAGRFYHAEGADGRLPDEIIGKNVWQANPIVVEILRQHGALIAERKVEHSYPHCWRCHKPTIFRATEQWFIGMDRKGLRAGAVEAIKKIRWMPSWGEDRMMNMIAGRPDWCISRQRVWGVPITVFYCESCQEPMEDTKILRRIVKEFREHTADVWYSRSVAELTGGEAKCAKCGGTDFRKESDILDVWFDSGVSHLVVMTPENGMPWPAQVYLEGGDQYRGWFQSSLLTGVGLRDAAPYSECVTAGWLLDAQGRAMSKSLGNSIEPDQVINKYGADVLRLWVASVEYNDDVRMSEAILKQIADAYFKLRNTFRYALGNTSDFDPAQHAVAGGDLEELDQWILLRAAELVRKCRDWYEEYAFHKVYRAIYDFATIDLSSVYFDISKDILYASAPNWRRRRSAQTAIARVNSALVRLLAPLIAFTTDEVWSHMANPAGSPESVHLAEFPKAEELIEGITAEQRQRGTNLDRLMPVRERVLKSLDAARQEKIIGSALEARVALEANGDLYPLLNQYAVALPGLFIVSQVEVRNSAGDDLGIRIDRAHGTKCVRCWKYTADVGSDAAYPTVCAPCAQAVHDIAAEGGAIA